MIISTFRSCYSPAFYQEVADEKDGIGLFFLFMVACVLMMMAYAVLIYSFGLDFAGNLREILNANGGETVTALAAGFSRPVVNFSVITLLCVFLLMMLMIDIAIVCAMVCMVISLALQAHLGFAQVLRLAVHAQVAAYAILALLAFILYKADVAMTLGALKALWIGLTLGYATFGMYCAKSG